MSRLEGVALMLMLLATASAQAVVLTGEVRSVGAQQLITPQSNMSPVTIRFFAPEGQAVKAGDPVLRIDPGQSAAQVPDLEAQIEQSRAKIARDVAGLEVKAVDAELALVDAEAELAAAKLNASIPANLIAALDHDRYRGELDSAMRETALKRRELGSAKGAVVRRTKDGQLEINKLVVQRDYHAALVRTSEIRADRDGIVVHGFNNNWIGGRIDEGSTTMPGSRAGEVVGDGRMEVRAWVLESDRRAIWVEQLVRLRFDAVPGQDVGGRVTAIAGAPERKAEWGEGRYFAVDIALDQTELPLLPGMSVRVVATQSVGAVR
ncbi:multidrug efflux pump subunit AcrA (membrane-fusion protein) [Xanthomonas arboricola]|uniref:HlyD family secretion protein n=1 Tax=Xanthomonas TaxID=338 RepID=UPI00141BB090|nr:MULTISPECIES: HlyD family efflux transporter periplasmic adaptor subunit [Xanthomonas]MDV2450088.1 HlyD family efflux transporter periplasmic adaptor subunit [Xanthomonas hortorum NBC5720]NIK40899.1 multidrug efflux pump subunit AcrA (membrane-fusion protein) [Xanthomonas euroxanthea]